MFKLDNNFLTSLGLGSLPVDEKNKLLQHIYERLEMNVGMRLAEKMTDQQLDEFEGFIDRNDEQGALRWLETNFPNYKDVVAQELEKLKTEISQAAPQILAAAGGAAAPTQPSMGQPQQPMQAMPNQPGQPSPYPQTPPAGYGAPALSQPYQPQVPNPYQQPGQYAPPQPAPQPMQGMPPQGPQPTPGPQTFQPAPGFTPAPSQPQPGYIPQDQPQPSPFPPTQPLPGQPPAGSPPQQ